MFAFYMNDFIRFLRGRNVYFLESTGTYISHKSNLFKPLLHVIVTSCNVNCADTFKYKNPGLYESNAKLSPLKYTNKEIVWHICTCISSFKQEKYFICLGFELHLYSFILSVNVSLSYLICPRDKCHICPSTKHRQI